ncbi:hypothetical protein JT05_12175 [Desulfosporosinus sp. Tol-M]|nr:hypothetical protein JT05_12175 [Desulfosporosinus sp. Tol-M]
MFIYGNELLLADQVKSADTFFQRFVGLMGQKSLGGGQGLLLKNCSSVHCFFMHFPIDVVYLSKFMEVLYVETIQPWHIGSFVKKAKHVLELPAGSGQGLSAGTQISIEA